MIIKNAILKGIPYLEICLISVMKVSEANIIDVNTKTPIMNMVITCFKMYLSKSFILRYLIIDFMINFFKTFPQKNYNTNKILNFGWRKFIF